MLDAKTRRDALDKAITELAATPPYVDVVERLVCLRGVSTLTAFALTVELGDWSRFRPGSLGPFLGLTPSDKLSGERRRQGAITKTGNSHARRLLIEAAWHHRRPSRLSRTLETRRTGKSLAVRAQADPQRPQAPLTLAHARERASRARSSWSPSRANSQGTSGRSQRWSSRARQRLGEESAPAQRREERTERTLRAAPSVATLDPRDRHRSSSRIPGHAAPTRAYESRHRRRRQPVRSPRRDPNPAHSGANNVCPLDRPALHMSVAEDTLYEGGRDV